MDCRAFTRHFRRREQYFLPSEAAGMKLTKQNNATCAFFVFSLHTLPACLCGCLWFSTLPSSITTCARRTSTVFSVLARLWEKLILRNKQGSQGDEDWCPGFLRFRQKQIDGTCNPDFSWFSRVPVSREVDPSSPSQQRQRKEMMGKNAKKPGIKFLVPSFKCLLPALVKFTALMLRQQTSRLGNRTF